MGKPLDMENWSKQTQEVCHLCLEKLRAILNQVDVSGINVATPGEFYNLTNSIAAVAKAIHNLEMSTRDRKALLIDVRDEFRKDCQKMLRARPDLHQQIMDLIENAEANTRRRLELD